MKKIKFVIIFLFLTFSNAFSMEADIFVQSTVNRASAILADDISKEKKIEDLKLIAKETVDIKGIGLYTLGNVRKSLNENQKKEYHLLFEK